MAFGKSVAFAVALIAGALTNAYAASTDAAYLAQMARAQRIVTLATFASTCGLRSDDWFESIAAGYQQFSVETANRFHIGNAGLDAADAQAKRIMAKMHSEYTCTKLRNSTIMDSLDHFQWEVTGGYH